MPRIYKVSVDVFVEAFDGIRARGAVALAIHPFQDVLNDGFVIRDTALVRLQNDDPAEEADMVEYEERKKWEPDDTYFVGMRTSTIQHACQRYHK
jgi:hypothetical protein